MAKVEYGNIINEITGHVGGLTFQKNASGYIIRRNPTQTKNYSIYQNYQINLLNNIQKTYKNLSGTDKLSWVNLANSLAYVDRWGLAGTITGAQLFFAINYNYFQFYNSYLNSAPAYVNNLPYQSFSVTLAANSVSLDWTIPQISANQTINIYASPPMPAGSAFPRSKMKLMLLDENGNFNSYDIGSQWENIFGLSVQSDVIDKGNIVHCYVCRSHKLFWLPSLITSSFS